MSSVTVLTRGASSRSAVTVASCQFSAAKGLPPPSVAAVAFFEPRVAAVVVAEGLPEPGLVALDESNTADPFGALPEVQVRHHEPCRAAVLRRERVAVVAVG